MRMATEPFFTTPLARFARRVCYANVVKDRMVPFSTSAILSFNPLFPARPGSERAGGAPNHAAAARARRQALRSPPPTLAPAFPHVVASRIPSAHELAPESSWFGSHAAAEPLLRARLRRMLAGLDALGWERVATFLPYTGVFATAHTQLVCGWPMGLANKGADCVRHLALSVARTHHEAAAREGRRLTVVASEPDPPLPPPPQPPQPPQGQRGKAGKAKGRGMEGGPGDEGIMQLLLPDGGGRVHGAAAEAEAEAEAEPPHGSHHQGRGRHPQQHPNTAKCVEMVARSLTPSEAAVVAFEPLWLT